MAQVERAKEDGKDSRRQKARQQRSKRTASAGPANIRVQDWVGIAALVTAFAEAGGAIRIGYTRDGGAFAVGCYLGDDYSTEYIRLQEDFTQALEEIATAWLENAGEAYHTEYNRFAQAAKPRKGD